MEKIIDLFSRLLIATITFVVPIIINLLSSFAEGEKRRRELAEDTANYLAKQALEEIQSNPGGLKQTISRTHNELQKNERDTQRKISLLNPVKQFWNIFISLAFSFVFLVMNYLIYSNHWGLHNPNWLVYTIIASVLAYCVALYFIIRILYTVSRTKKII